MGLKALTGWCLELKSGQLEAAGLKALDDFADKTALDTKGNAEAALVWAEANQFSTLRLVTANYHLPRAYLEFSRLLTDKQIDSWAVIPPDLQPRDWFRHWPTVRLLAREYAKYLFALVRL